MSQPLWLPSHCVPDSQVLPFPAVRESQTVPQSELGGALTYASPENLVLQSLHLAERIARLAPSLNQDQILTVLADLLTIEAQRLEPLQHFVERQRSFLSDLSARQAKKRRRRQRRVKEQEVLRSA